MKKAEMHLSKTCLVLILITLLTAACGPSALTRQANSPNLTTAGDLVQLLPGTSTPAINPSQPHVSYPSVTTGSTKESGAVYSVESDPEFNPESSFPLAPDTRFDPGNGGAEEVESSGAFLLHSQASVETVSQFYISALPRQGWQLRYIDANYAGGETQYWKQGLFYMSLDFAYDNAGLAIQALWHQVNLEHVGMLPESIPLPDRAEIVDATDSTWQVFIPVPMQASIEYYQQKAAELDWEFGSILYLPAASCGGDCANQSSPTYPSDVTPMPTPTSDSRQPQVLAYTMSDGNQVSLEFHPQQEWTILDITLTLKNVESAGLPREVPIYPGATDLVIAPGLLRFTVPADLKTTVQYYVHAMTGSGWTPSAGYSLDTPELYYQEWDKGEQSLRINISMPGSSSQSSLVSIQCLQCSVR